ncbi:hypothetical protein L9F63_007018, partial [Diploptera punctata]
VQDCPGCSPDCPGCSPFQDCPGCSPFTTGLGVLRPMIWSGCSPLRTGRMFFCQKQISFFILKVQDYFRNSLSVIRFKSGLCKVYVRYECSPVQPTSFISGMDVLRFHGVYVLCLLWTFSGSCLYGPCLSFMPGMDILRLMSGCCVIFSDSCLVLMFSGERLGCSPVHSGSCLIRVFYGSDLIHVWSGMDVLRDFSRSGQPSSGLARNGFLRLRNRNVFSFSGSGIELVFSGSGIEMVFRSGSGIEMVFSYMVMAWNVSSVVHVWQMSEFISGMDVPVNFMCVLRFMPDNVHIWYGCFSKFHVWFISSMEVLRFMPGMYLLRKVHVSYGYIPVSKFHTCKVHVWMFSRKGNV